MKNYRLSLNLSSRSASYAIAELGDGGEVVGLASVGTHYFDDGREAKTRDSLAKTRRSARLARRVRDRRLQRKHSLIHKFIKYGLLPESEKKTHNMKKLGQPHYFRHIALSQPLSKIELAWALFNLNQKRGFKNFKEDDEQKGVILNAQKIMLDDMKSETVGSYLHKRHSEGLPIKSRLEDYIFPSRQMLLDEFERIVSFQKPRHDLTDEAWEDIRKTIFHQRPLREVEKGPCLFFKNEKRAYLGLPSAKRLRMLEALSALKVKSKNRLAKASLEDFQSVYEQLIRSEKITKKEIETILGKKASLGRKTVIHGDRISTDMSKDEFFGEKWFSYPLSVQDDLVEMLIEKDPDCICAAMVSQYGLSLDRAKRISEYPVAGADSSTGCYSRKALRMLIGEMESEFIPVAEARTKIGFPEIAYKGEFERLKYYGEVLPHIVSNFKKAKENDEDIYGVVNNPSLHIVLNRVQKIVNSIIDSYGKPRQIIVKLQSDLKHSYELQEEKRKIRENNKKEIEAIKDVLKKAFGIENPMRYHILMYRLWVELNPKDPNLRLCPFSGGVISRENLFSDFVPMHIIPFKYCYDNSIKNRMLISNALVERVADKTPWEAFGGYSDGLYDNILKRIAKIPKEKRALFSENAKEAVKRKVTQQFSDMSRVSGYVKEYLTTVCESSWVVSQKLVSMLKDAWDLRETLPRDDLRIPIVDAAIAAGVDSDLSILSAFALNKRLDEEKIDVPKPFEGFNEYILKALGGVVVSHRMRHKKTGAFLQSAAYGRVDPEKNGGCNLTIRKSIFDVNPETIADKRIKDRLLAHLAAMPSEDDEIRKRLKSILDKKYNAVKDERIKESLAKYIVAIPEKKETELKKRLAKEELIVFSEMTGIKSVKTLVKKSAPIAVRHAEGTGREHVKHMLSAENHSVSIWVLPEGAVLRRAYDSYRLKEYKNVFVVTTQTLIASQKPEERPHPAAKLLMKIHKNDMLAVNHGDERIIVRVVGLDPCGQRIYVSRHNLDEKVGKTFRQLVVGRAEKISVDPVGRIQTGRNLFERYLKT